jgi:hypothetical protein
MQKIKEFYLSNYPTDELGNEIDANATFKGLFHILDTYQDVYKYIGIADSIIRERIFEKLANEMGIDYNEIYNQWLLAE